MINLRVTPEEALRLLNMIPNQTCLKAIKNQWRLDANNQVSAQSICWLFCWAKTGCSSTKAAKESEEVFDAILDMKCSFFDERVPHEWARKARYSKGNIEDELSAFLKG